MKLINKKAFSVVEILMWVFIFSLWMVWIYATISSTLNLNEYNKNYIIASNLAREQLELVRNIRDSNYHKLQKYNKIDPSTTDYTNIFEYSTKYIIENDYSNTASFPIKVAPLVWLWELCMDEKNRYTHDCTNQNNKKTKFSKYISIEKVSYNDSWTREDIDDAILIRSKVLWNIGWDHEFEVKTILTDWKRL